MIFFEEEQNKQEHNLSSSPMRRKLRKRDNKPDRYEAAVMKANRDHNDLGEPDIEYSQHHVIPDPKTNEVEKPMEQQAPSVDQGDVQHQPEQNNETLVFETGELEEASQSPSLEAQRDALESPRQEPPIPQKASITTKLTLFEYMAKETILAAKRQLLYTKCDCKMQFQLIRVKQSLATVYLLYAVGKTDRVFLCATKKQVSLNHTEFEVSLHRDLLEDIKGSELYAGHIRSSFTRDSYCFFQNYRVADFQQSRSCGSVEWSRPFLGDVAIKLILKYDNQGKEVRQFFSTLPTEKELFDMKHAWGITKSKKNIILKPKGEKEGVIRATLLLGKNNESKLTMVVAEEMSSFQAFCFAVSHLSYLE